MGFAKLFQKIYFLISQFISLIDRIEHLQEALGRVEMRQLALSKSLDLHDYEFQVFSQWGEDGIIQFIINHIPIENEIFVEFGVGDYTEANTRFLLKNANWSGLIIDGSEQNIQIIKQSKLAWRHDLRIECSFVTKDNINKLISKHNIMGDIGILSIDVDGNDYWIWNAIDCIQPRIVICEYNSLFGFEKAVTVPYDDNFIITEAHFSGLYWGASIAAFDFLAKKKGYSLIGSNSVGNNVFFVRDDFIGNIPTYTPEQAYVKSKFRISRSQDGELSFLNFEASLAAIQDMPLCDVKMSQLISVRDLFVTRVDR